MRKTVFIALLCLATFSYRASADDRAITLSKLPVAAQNFLNTHFKGCEVIFASEDWGLFDTDYSVMLVDGTKVEFDGKGEWESIQHKGAKIPTNLIPSQIINYVQQRFPAASISKIERDRRGYEVELTNGLELKFDLSFNCIEVDD